MSLRSLDVCKYLSNRFSILRTDNSVKHMKIYQKIEDGQTHYFLSTRRYFRTVVELVSFYERNDLGENFAG